MPITWLHISDFHIRGGDPYDRDIVLGALVRSVKEHCQRGRTPDLIFATGDIAYSGKDSEYAIATTFFNELLEATALSKRNLFLVPGNHDVDRNLGVGLARTLSTREEADQYFGPSIPKTHLIQKQKAFAQWFNSYFRGIRVFPDNSTCGPVEIVDVRGETIGILPLNSALFSQGDDDHEKLWIGRRTIDAAIDEIQRSSPQVKLALIHHPLDWLSGIERSNIKTKLYDNVDILLRGHLHENDVESTIGTTGNVLTIAAGAAYRTRQWPNRALYATLQNNGISIFPIRYEDQPHEVWTLDTSLFPNERDYQKFYEVPHLVAKQNLGVDESQVVSPRGMPARIKHRDRRKYSSGRILENVYVGDPTAEADADFLFRRGCFVETDIYNSCIELSSPQFIVGRRGTGKTALSMALERALKSDPNVLLTYIVPQPHYFAHAKALARVLAQQTGVNWEFLFRSIWAATLRSEWARSLLEYYKVRNSSLDDLAILQRFVDEAAPDPHESASARLSRYLTQIVQLLGDGNGDIVGSVNRLLVAYRFERVQQSLARIANTSGVTLVTLVDGLDENWDGSDASAELISGLLIQAAADYPAIGAITFAFIRENMYRRVSNICPRWDRIEGYFYQLGWTEEQIEDLILRRISSQRDEDHVTWDMVFAPTVNGVQSLQYLVGRTQFKPREVILFCRYALDAANRHRAEKVRAVDILEAERLYSINRLKDLLNEYEDSLPELRSIIELFIGKSQVQSMDDFLQLLDEFISSGKYLQVAPKLSLNYPNREGVFEVLLGVGFLGVKVESSGPFLFKYYGEQGNVFKHISEVEEVSVHPGFAQALGLLQGSKQIRTKEAEENEIVATSASITTRMTAAYEETSRILGQLRDIPPGAGGFKRYEDLMLAAISFAFQGYLDNPRVNTKSWGGAEIRDILFNNVGETRFFETIRDEHGAVTVPFKCKNKSVLEPGDFHQIESFLTEGASGRFGFICYRSDRREPLKQEIRYLREIYFRDSTHRKVVMLLSDANLGQLLEQRAKGKIDGFLRKMYTRYIRLYFA